MLVARLKDGRVGIAAGYWLFLVVSISMAAYSSSLNFQILACKQKRIDLGQPSSYLLQ